MSKNLRNTHLIFIFFFLNKNKNFIKTRGHYFKYIFDDKYNMARFTHFRKRKLEKDSMKILL